jgi:hypothetical protein
MCGPSGHLCIVDAPSVYGESLTEWRGNKARLNIAVKEGFIVPIYSS